MTEERDGDAANAGGSSQKEDGGGGGGTTRRSRGRRSRGRRGKSGGGGSRDNARTTQHTEPHHHHHRSISPSPPRDRQHFRRTEHRPLRDRDDDDDGGGEKGGGGRHHRSPSPSPDPNRGEHRCRDGGAASRRKNHNNTGNDDVNASASEKTSGEYYVPVQPIDDDLPVVDDEDPRGNDPTKRITQSASRRGSGRNTESFDPGSTLVRPDLRILVGNGRNRTYNRPLKHDDCVIVPELFGPEDDWTLYYKLVDEMRDLQRQNVKGSEWISWHEGAHLISKNPKGSPTFETIIDRLCEYFCIQKKSIGTRFNWYRDSSDWKPFHHDSAAFNPQRAKTQNITVGVSFGATRELAFIRASPLENGDKVKLYFPQTNNGVFSFGRDANILWKHGVNALPPAEQDGKGRVSIILWGLAQDVIEEDGSPPLLGSDGRGPHAARLGDRRGGRSGDGRRNRRRRGNNNNSQRHRDGGADQPRDEPREKGSSDQPSSL